MKNNDIMEHVNRAPKLMKITSNSDLLREVDNFKDRNSESKILNSNKNLI